MRTRIKSCVSDGPESNRGVWRPTHATTENGMRKMMLQTEDPISDTVHRVWSVARVGKEKNADLHVVKTFREKGHWIVTCYAVPTKVARKSSSHYPKVWGGAACSDHLGHKHFGSQPAHRKKDEDRGNDKQVCNKQSS